MSDLPARPSLTALFLGFLSVGALGFGGVLPWARRLVVEQRRWLTAAEFADLLGLCQFLPGGNIMNLTIALGSRFRGILGAIAAFLGLMTGPVIVVIGLGIVYDQYKDFPPVERAFTGLAAAAAGYVLATGLRIAAPLRGRPLALAIAAASFIAIAVLRLPLALALPILGLASTALLWRFQA